MCALADRLDFQAVEGLWGHVVRMEIPAARGHKVKRANPDHLDHPVR